MISPHDKMALKAVLERIAINLPKPQQEQLIGFCMKILEFFPQETKCRDCVHFDNGNCKKWNDAIPEDFQKTGCDQWLFDKSSPPF